MLGVVIHVSAFSGMANLQDAPPALLAAGCLREAMSEVLPAYQAHGGNQISVRFGPFGKLSEEIEQRLKVDVFASASVDHTEALARHKFLGNSKEFIKRNTKTC